MATENLEQRVAALEREVEAIKRSQANTSNGRNISMDWKLTFGAFANDPGYLEMVRLGREIRQQEREDEDLSH